MSDSTGFSLICPQCQMAYALPAGTPHNQAFQCRQCQIPLVHPSSSPPTAGASSPSNYNITRDLIPQGIAFSSRPDIREVVPGKRAPYRILSILGEGGYGRVYEVADPFLKRPMALKVLLEQKNITQSMKLKPRLTKAYLCRAQIYIFQGKSALATRDMKAYLRLYPNAPQAPKLRQYIRQFDKK